MTDAAAAVAVSTEKRSFFFAKEIPYGIAIARMLLPLSLMTNVLERWPWVRELYSSDGAPAPLADNFGYFGFLPEFPGSVDVALFTMLTFAMIFSSIGWCTRFSLMASAILYSYFGMMDCISTITKYTVIASHLLVLLSVSRCGEVWSVDSWWRRRSGVAPTGDGPTGLKFEIWPQRLIQLFLGMMYLGAAITKTHIPAFFSGDQLMYWMMTYINNVHPVGDWLSQYPLLLASFGYITIIWEVAFIVAVFQPKLKWWTISIGASFHIMTALTLGLFIFPPVMIASYFAFVTEDEMNRVLTWPVWRGIGRRLAAVPQVAGTAWQSAWNSWGRLAGCYALVMAALCVGAVEIEHWMDPYKLRGPDGPLPLRELTQEEVDRIFNFEVPLRQVDKLHAFDLGSKVIGEHLLMRKREFRHGETIIGQVSLNPPHEDMWLDCQLTESEAQEGDDGQIEYVPGKLLNKVGQILPRESLRGTFIFTLDEACPPGEYFLRLRSGNEEIARRRFTLSPRVGAPAAN